MNCMRLSCWTESGAWRRALAVCVLLALLAPRHAAAAPKILTRIYPKAELPGVTAMAFSPSEPILAIAATDRSLRLLNAADGSGARSLAAPNAVYRCLSFDAMGSRIAVGGTGLVYIWDAKAGTLLRRIKSEFGKVATVMFSADGLRLAIADEAGSIHILDANSLTLQRTLKAGYPAVQVAFSPAGGHVAAVCGGRLFVWSTADGTLQEAGKGSVGITGVAFGSSGIVLTGSRDGAVRVWDVMKAKPVNEFTDQRGAIFSVAADGGGALLATFSLDGSIVLRSGETGNQLRKIEQEVNQGSAASISPDGRFLACLFRGKENTLKLWSLDRAAIGGAASARTTAGPAFLSELERNVLFEINMVRSDPAGYVAKLETLRSRFDGGTLRAPNGTSISTSEGMDALDDAVKYLNEARRSPPLMVMEPLCKVAAEASSGAGDVQDRIQRSGIDSSVCGESVASGPDDAAFLVALMVMDDGSVGRIRRENIMNGDFTSVGVNCRKGPGGTQCIVVLATPRTPPK